MSSPEQRYVKRLIWLKETHKQLNKKIDYMEETGEGPTESLTDLKKQRLLYKDEIERMEKENNEASISNR
jgi:uncharacterized protein YdcH (DUF465 family)